MDSRDATEGDEVVSLMSSLRDLEKWTAEIKFFPCKKFVRFTGNAIVRCLNRYGLFRFSSCDTEQLKELATGDTGSFYFIKTRSYAKGLIFCSTSLESYSFINLKL